MSNLTRRGFTLGALAGVPIIAGCANGVGGAGGARIDARVNATLEHMYSRYPGTRDLAEKSNGMLIMPLITEGAFVFGGGYGQGALRIDNVTVDYYSATKGSVGFQIGAKQFAHVLFFMTDEALERFRRGSGWAAGGDIQYVFKDTGETPARRHDHIQFAGPRRDLRAGGADGGRVARGLEIQPHHPLRGDRLGYLDTLIPSP